MNTEIDSHRLGISFICVGIGIYLLALELVRLVNHFAAKLSPLTMEIYALSLFVCSALITVGIIMIVRRDAAKNDNRFSSLILGIVSFPILCIALFYCAYFVPYTQNWNFEAGDWLLFFIICLVGISLVAWGVNFSRRSNDGRQ